VLGWSISIAAACSMGTVISRSRNSCPWQR
jgi:hypothetical protein